MRVELGNARPQTKVDGVPEPTRGAAVTYINIPDGDDQYGNPLYSFPDADQHDDATFPAEIAEALASISSETAKATLRRTIIDGWFAHPSAVRGLPDHAAFVAVVHPSGAFNEVSLPSDDPTWVWSDHSGLEHLLSLYYGCPAGRPDDLEDTHWTVSGAGLFMPGAHPDPLGSIEMMHTSWGRDNQAIQQGGTGFVGQAGVLTAATATTATFATGVSHGANDLAGQYLFVGPNTSGVGSTVYGFIVSNTSGTTPVVTVDRWYTAATPGGAAGTTPNATGSYLVATGGPPAQFVALSTDTTVKALLGTGGTADAGSITQTLTGENTTAGGGLLRKIGVAAHTAGQATWTNTPVFTATAADQSAGAFTVGTAALSPSMSQAVGALHYMTLVTPTATLTATGDQLTLTWTFTMT